VHDLLWFMKKSIVLTLIVSVLSITACDNEKSNNDKNSSFDRSIFLKNIATTIIIPNFVVLQNKTDLMDVAIQKFGTNSNEVNLIAAQTAWEEAYTAWQHCSAFNFGPAELPVFGTLNENIAIFPVNTAKIEDNIGKNNLSFDNFARDTRGFLALDYLIFDLENNSKVLEKYGSMATVRKQYMLKVSADIKKKVDDVNKGWMTYSTTFIANNGTDAGSSTSYLYNEFIKSFESIKNFKVSLPAGKRVGQSKSEPEKVEAYYSGKSVKFLKEHLKAIENIWVGKATNGSDGIGFEEYLASVTGGKELIASTKAQLIAVDAATNALPNERLSKTIQTNISVVETLSNELQKQTRFYKSDMSSLLGIAITFNSGDGD
jgi:predicted lipoprotein